MKLLGTSKPIKSIPTPPLGYKFVQPGEEIEEGDIIAFSNGGRLFVEFEDGKVAERHAKFFDAYRKWAGGKPGWQVKEGDENRVIRLVSKKENPPKEIKCPNCERMADEGQICWWCGIKN